MTLDEKLDNFYNSAIDAATTQSQEIIEDYKQSLQKVYDDHKETALRKASISVTVESETLIRERNRALSAEAIVIRKKISDKSKELSELIFVDIRTKINAFMTTPEYTQLLIDQINAAVSFAKGEAITIYINPSDEDKKTVLEGAAHMEFTVSTIDFIGGTRAVIHAKNILIDNSFLTKLAEEKDNFTI